jgi:RimK family alpha-L-glutamate ligase
MAAPDIVVLGGGTGWHAARLRGAFRTLGVRARSVPFAQCGFDPDGVRLGQARTLPDVVLVRTIPAGSFEQVTVRLGVLHALAGLGVAVINDARAIERCVDKSTTAFLLARAGVPTPETWTTEEETEARRLVAMARADGRALVLKPLFGAQGNGLRLIASPEELPAPDAVAGVYHLQRFVGGAADWQDLRVFVVADRAVAAMRRYGAGWITNIRQGGRAEPLDLPVYAGVDVIAGPDGRLQLLEVNSMPAWQALQGVSRVDIAQALARAVLAAAEGPAAARRAEA